MNKIILFFFIAFGVIYSQQSIPIARAVLNTETKTKAPEAQSVTNGTDSVWISASRSVLRLDSLKDEGGVTATIYDSLAIGGDSLLVIFDYDRSNIGSFTKEFYVWHNGYDSPDTATFNYTVYEEVPTITAPYNLVASNNAVDGIDITWQDSNSASYAILISNQFDNVSEESEWTATHGVTDEIDVIGGQLKIYDNALATSYPGGERKIAITPNTTYRFTDSVQVGTANSVGMYITDDNSTTYYNYNSTSDTTLTKVIENPSADSFYVKLQAYTDDGEIAYHESFLVEELVTTVDNVEIWRRIYFSGSPDDAWTKIATQSATDLTYTDNVAENIEYGYRARFSKGSDYSDYSAEDTAIFSTVTASVTPDYYVSSSSGNDSNDGTTEATAWASIGKVNSMMGSYATDDIIAFKRGDVFSDSNLVVNDNDLYITAYGTGNKPVIGDSNSTTLQWGVIANNDSNVTIDGLTILASKHSTYSGGVYFKGDSLTLTNCTIRGSSESVQRGSSGIAVGEGSSYIDIDNNSVDYFGVGIVGYASQYVTIDSNAVYNIQRYDGNYGGFGIRLISNTFEDPAEPDWWYDFNYTGVISHNDVYNFSRYGIDCASASNVIIEYNSIHDNVSDPTKSNEYGSGIKAGEKNATRLHEGSEGNIVRYNKIYNLSNGGSGDGFPNSGITTVNSIDGDIYYNLIYDIEGTGIWRTGLSADSTHVIESWDIYNNVIIAGQQAFYSEYYTRSNTNFKNNIVEADTSSYAAIYCKTYKGNFISDYNIFTNTSGYSTSSIAGKIMYDPAGNSSVGANDLAYQSASFTDTTNADYSLLAGSVAIDSGTSIGNDKQGNAITTDIIGNTIDANPDIGAYEK